MASARPRDCVTARLQVSAPGQLTTSLSLLATRSSAVSHEISSKLGVNAPKVLLMTSRDTVRERGVILMSGADGAIQKPFALNELHQKVQEILSQAKERS